MTKAISIATAIHLSAFFASASAAALALSGAMTPAYGAQEQGSRGNNESMRRPPAFLSNREPFEQRWRAAKEATLLTSVNAAEKASRATSAQREASASSDGPDRAKRKSAKASKCQASPLSPDEIEALIEETAVKHGVNADFAKAISWVESRFDRDRNSLKGARGPMQLMPATAARFQVRDICDPAQNIEGGVKYLRALLNEFQNPILAAAAYNAGESRIYEYGGVPPFRETVNYVAKVLNHQLGVSLPTSKKKVSPPPSQPLAAQASPALQADKSGEFINGVMHF